MKALVLENYNQLVYKDVDIPVYKDNEVLIQVKACGICGSDVHGFDGSTGRRLPPIIMGHEASGIVKEVGSAVKNWKTGDRVTFDSTVYDLNDWYVKQGMYNLSDSRRVLGVSCKDFKMDGAFAEYVAVPEHILYKIPSDLSFNQAASVEPVSVALHAVNITTIREDDTVLVIGAGIIGLFVIQAVKALGCKNILAVDLVENRLKLAQRFGAHYVYNPTHSNITEEIKNKTAKRGVDIAFEVVGTNKTINTAIACTRKGGAITLVGNLSPKVEIPLQTVVAHQLKIQGSYAICGEYPVALRMIEEGKIIVDPLISASAPLSEGASWFKRLYNKEENLFKVILVP